MAVAVSNGVARRQPNLHLVVSSLTSRVADSSLQLQSNEDSVYEQDIIRDTTSIKPWLVYIDFKAKHGSIQERAFVMGRACAQLPRSYKLWKVVGLMSVLTWYLR